MPTAPRPADPVHVEGSRAGGPRARGGRPAVGVDIGGSGVRVAVVDATGHVVDSRTAHWTTLTPPPPSGVVDRVVELVRDLGVPPGAPVGVAVPGTLDPATGGVGRATNLAWEDTPLADLATRALGVTVRVLHDADAAAEAERRLGVATPDHRTLVVPIGTGISATLVARDRVVPDLAGELGHLDVGTGRQCPCGATGCLETVASASALARRWRSGGIDGIEGAEGADGVEGAEGADGAGSGAPAGGGARAVVEAVRSGDVRARHLWAEATGALTTALVAATRLIGPDLVVLTGGLAAAGDLLSGPVGDGLAARAGFQPAPRVVTSTLGPLAGAVGAALSVTADARRHPGPDDAAAGGGPARC